MRTARVCAAVPSAPVLLRTAVVMVAALGIHPACAPSISRAPDAGIDMSRPDDADLLYAWIANYRTTGIRCPRAALVRYPAPPRRSAALDVVSRRRAIDLARTGRFEHDRAVSSWVHEAGYQGHFGGELLAERSRTADATVRAWLTSVTHCGPLASSTLTDVGVGVALAPDGRRVWVAELGARSR